MKQEFCPNLFLEINLYENSPSQYNESPSQCNVVHPVCNNITASDIGLLV